jgi:hypothetical protein
MIAWGLIRPLNKRAQRALSVGVKRWACGGDHSPPFVPKLRKFVAVSRLLPYAFMACTGETKPFVLSFHLYVQYCSREDVTKHEPDGHVLLAQTFTLYLYKLELPADIYSDTLAVFHSRRNRTNSVANQYLLDCNSVSQGSVFECQSSLKTRYFESKH